MDTTRLFLRILEQMISYMRQLTYLTTSCKQGVKSGEISFLIFDMQTVSNTIGNLT